VSAAGDAGRLAPLGGPPLRSTRIALAWTPDGRIVYSDPAGEHSSLWVTDPAGGSRRPLGSDHTDTDQIVIAPDGRTIVYKQDGNIWRMDEDGTHARQLTHGSLDVHPDVSADGRSVFYASFAGWSPAVGGEPNLWSVTIEGGEAHEILRQPASYPRVSPDGKRLGCIYFPGKDPRTSADLLATLGLDGTGGLKVFDASPSDETPISWSPRGEALDYILNAGGVGNIWRQPAGGGPPSRVTNFESGELFTFAWSRDGRLACVRGATTRGMVLIERSR
jgi:Tol biopolymer transport system component